MRSYDALVDRQLLASLLRFAGLVWNQKFLPDLQFARVLDVIERDQIVVRDFKFLGNRHRIIALDYDLGLS